MCRRARATPVSSISSSMPRLASCWPVPGCISSMPIRRPICSRRSILPRPIAWVSTVDADGRRYLDYHAAFGPYILGHNHPRVNAAVRAALERVDLIGAGVTDLEVRLAEKLVQHIPCAERVMLANSGSEATYYALRLARAATGRRKIDAWYGPLSPSVATFDDEAALPNINTRPALRSLQDSIPRPPLGSRPHDCRRPTAPRGSQSHSPARQPPPTHVAHRG